MEQEKGYEINMTGIDPCEVFGDGDAEKGRQIAQALAERLYRARLDHPQFAKNAIHGMNVVAAEFNEFRHAVRHESRERQLDEALDVAVTALRFFNEEFEQIKELQGMFPHG